MAEPIRFVAIPAIVYVAEKNALAGTMSDARINQDFLRRGFFAGSRAANTTVDGDEELKNTLELMLTTTGFGELNLFEATEGIYSIKLTRSPEIEQGKGQPTCYYLTGLLEGFFQQVLGRPVECIEDECESAGKPACNFVLIPKEVPQETGLKPGEAALILTSEDDRHYPDLEAIFGEGLRFHKPEFFYETIQKEAGLGKHVLCVSGLSSQEAAEKYALPKRVECVWLAKNPDVTSDAFEVRHPQLWWSEINKFVKSYGQGAVVAVSLDIVMSNIFAGEVSKLITGLRDMAKEKKTSVILHMAAYRGNDYRSLLQELAQNGATYVKG